MAESLPFDRVADRYDETRGGERRGRDFADVVARYLVPGPALEVGVGTGLVAHALARHHGVPTLGVDLSAAMLTRANARLGGRVALGDARRLPVRDGSVHNAVFVASLHAIVDVAAAFAEAVRVVRPGGRVVVLASTGNSGDDRSAEIAPLLAGLPGGRPLDGPEAVLAGATGVGLRRVESRQIAVGSHGETPNELAESIETKAWSNLWNVDGAVWATTVLPIVRGLRELPDPDLPRDRWLTFHLSVFDR